jgi:hypothetical protein
MKRTKGRFLVFLVIAQSVAAQTTFHGNTARTVFMNRLGLSNSAE